MGAKYKGKKVGSLADISFFSFGRDKVISSVSGGMILCRNKSLYDILKNQRDALSYPGPFWLLQQLLHPIMFSLIIPFYNFGCNRFTLGKMMLFLLQKVNLLSKAVYNEEKLGKRPKHFPAKMPGALAVLAINQFKKLDGFNKHRREIADFYFKNMNRNRFKLPVKKTGSIYVRFPVTLNNADRLFDEFKNKGVLLGDWYRDCVVPVKDPRLVGYIRGSCSKAEELCGKMLNLPTYPCFNINDAKYLLSLIK